MSQDHDREHRRPSSVATAISPTNGSISPAYTSPLDRRALRHAATVKRRAERVGAIADRLLALVADATGGQGDPAGSLRRAAALGILLGVDGARDLVGSGEEGGGILKTWPANLIGNSLAAAMQAARLSADLTEQALALDVQRAAAKAGAVARATVASTIDAKAEARAREQAAWVAAGAATPRTETRGRSAPPALFDETDHDAPPDPLARYFTVEVEAPDDLPEPIVPGQAAHDAGGDDTGRGG